LPDSVDYIFWGNAAALRLWNVLQFIHGFARLCNKIFFCSDPLDASTYHTDYGLKPSFAKPSVPDDEGLHFLTGVETPAYDKPSVPDETPSVPDEKPSVPDETPSVPDEKPSVPDEKRRFPIITVGSRL